MEPILSAPSPPTEILSRATRCVGCTRGNEFRHAGSIPGQRLHGTIKTEVAPYLCTLTNCAALLPIQLIQSTSLKLQISRLLRLLPRPSHPCFPMAPRALTQCHRTISSCSFPMFALGTSAMP